MKRIDGDTPWLRDYTARALVAVRGEMTLVEIAAAMGCTKQNVANIERRALAKLVVAVKAEGLSRSDVLQWLSRSRKQHPLDITEQAEDWVPRRVTPDQPLPVEGYSNEAMRAEDALSELERRLELINERLVSCET